jgi:hypothetical protein
VLRHLMVYATEITLRVACFPVSGVLLGCGVP